MTNPVDSYLGAYGGMYAQTPKTQIQLHRSAFKRLNVPTRYDGIGMQEKVA